MHHSRFNISLYDIFALLLYNLHFLKKPTFKMDYESDSESNENNDENNSHIIALGHNRIRKD